MFDNQLIDIVAGCWRRWPTRCMSPRPTSTSCSSSSQTSTPCWMTRRCGEDTWAARLWSGDTRTPGPGSPASPCWRRGGTSWSWRSSVRGGRWAWISCLRSVWERYCANCQITEMWRMQVRREHAIIDKKYVLLASGRTTLTMNYIVSEKRIWRELVQVNIITLLHCKCLMSLCY